MAILIKRFKVRHNGVTYGPGEPGGEILHGLSQEEEDKLIALSNGTIERHADPKRKVEPEEAERPKLKYRRKKGGK